MKIIHVQITVAAFVGALTLACGSDSSTAQTSVGGTPTGSSADSEVAQSAAQSPDDASSADEATVGHGPQASFLLADEIVQHLTNVSSGLGTFTTTFNLNDCTAEVALTTSDTNNTWTLDANVTVNPNTCTGVRKWSGSEQIVATWSNNSNNFARTVTAQENISTTFKGGDTITVTSLDPNTPYTAQLQATGQASNGNTQSSVSLNQHRVLVNSSGAAIYDHNVTTPTPVSINTAYSVTISAVTATSRTLVSGEVDVHHNLAHFNATHTFSNLLHVLDGSCACPSSGSITQNVTLDNGKGSYTRVYTFTGCGTATVATSNSTLAGTTTGSESITWNNCTE